MTNYSPKDQNPVLPVVDITFAFKTLVDVVRMSSTTFLIVCHCSMRPGTELAERNQCNRLITPIRSSLQEAC